MSTGQKTVFAPYFCESVRFYSLFSLLLCNLSIFAGSDENFFPPPLDSAVYTCYPNCTNTLNTAGGAYVPLDFSDPGSCCTAARHFAARRAVQPMNAGGMP
jgi:hypothetical protein